MLRSILGVRLTDKIPVGEIYKRTQARGVPVVARSLKYKYAGHTIRDNTKKWNTVLSSWTPHWGKRSRGDPTLDGQMSVEKA